MSTLELFFIGFLFSFFLKLTVAFISRNYCGKFSKQLNLYLSDYTSGLRNIYEYDKSIFNFVFFIGLWGLFNVLYVIILLLWWFLTMVGLL